MAEHTRIYYSEDHTGQLYFARELAGIQHVKTEDFREAIRKALARWNPSIDAVDCLARLLVSLDPTNYHHKHVDCSSELKKEIKLLQDLCAFYDSQVPELASRWNDIKWHPEMPRMATAHSQVHGIEYQTALMGIAAHRRLDILQHELSLCGSVQTHEPYQVMLFSLSRLYYCNVPGRVDGRGKKSPMYPQVFVLHVMQQVLAECNVPGVNRRHEIIAILAQCAGVSIGPDSVKAKIAGITAKKVMDWRDFENPGVVMGFNIPR